MLIANYNFAQAGDVLLVTLRQDSASELHEKKNDIVRIYDEKSGETIGYNFFKAASYLGELQPAGKIDLTAAQVEVLNEQLSAAGFPAELVVDDQPYFVVGHVAEISEHPDSDHLHVLKVEVDKGEELKIVCGAPNIAADQTVVIAKVGAMMPSGAIIWPGKLRGQESFGMVCSARELALPNAPQKRGILELPAADYQTGEPFDFQKAATMFAAE
ncbi:tRNA-binding protein [Ligilactobacillus pabuli]|uniref:tRNA-binding protein n=1 Tax=Ligilactobacillus pabuli TaxID=2886039 RepID=A0ABQ5JG22_9LACO|nr:DUF4479 and tRNA-binding domain-containing protein [Ligilactobacillus pabuli]GKS80960.1 tRNA-binding protein [Ligilactobacillus pabuli]